MAVITLNRAPISDREFIVLMALLMSVTAFSIDAMLPALGIMGVDLQASYSNQTQYIISVVFVGLSLGQLIFGPLADAIGRTKTLYIGMLLYLLGSFVCLFSQSIEIMLLGRFIQGLGVSGPYISSTAIIRDKFNGREMARISSLIMMLFIMVPVLAPAFGQLILHFASWHFIFVVYILYALIVLIWIFLRLDESLSADKRIALTLPNIVQSVGIVFGNRSTLAYAACRSLVFGGMIGYLNSSRQIFQDLFGVGDRFFIYFGCLALMLGISSLLNARLVMRYGMRFICLVATYAIIAAALGFLIFSLLYEVKLWAFVAFVAFIFFNMGFLFGNLNALSMEPMGDVAGTATAVIGSMSSLVSIVLGTLIGQFYDGTLIPLSWGYFLLGMLSLGFMYLAENNKNNTLNKIDRVSS